MRYYEDSIVFEYWYMIILFILMSLLPPKGT